MQHARHSVMVAAALAVSALISQPASAASTPTAQSCSKTAGDAYSACLYDQLDTFWISSGKCRNVEDSTERSTCFSEAKAALPEGRQLCVAQRAARLDLCEDIGEAPYDPDFEGALFVNPNEIGRSVAPNPYYPLVAGQKRVYRSGAAKTTVTITNKIAMFGEGVPCRVVTDTHEENGVVQESTVDWFAQDIQGNVWYCGEATREQDADGNVTSIDGSFKAGENGAKPGLVMKAAPQVGDTYLQEFDLGNAEDAAEVLSINGSATVPVASCRSTCVVTEDTTALEPTALEKKYYAPGIGQILEVKPSTGARNELVEFRH